MNLHELKIAVMAAELQANSRGISLERVGVRSLVVTPGASSAQPQWLPIQAVEVNEYVDPGELNLEVAIVAHHRPIIVNS